MYPTNAPNTVSSPPHDHFFDAVLSAEAVSGSTTRAIDVEINWNSSDGAYRIRVAEVFRDYDLAAARPEVAAP